MPPEPPAVTAVLGPTNTGKTHRATERMLEHESGMIGLPLRLLAREVYDRVTARVGEGACALVTGEEKRVPERPRYWVCTVEAMPRDREVDFVAVDEIQLCGHRERGHVFTDSVLHARGRRETFLLGAETMRAPLASLVPEATIEKRPRLSTLTGAGSLSLGALPPRTAVVAFSAARVYELAERLRAKRGGAAVVLGALSPRARNAQVALYQSGEVDYLAATDAIGMGLNLDLDCVAFADVRKFDGRQARPLELAELAQIAGRAGRFHNDGRFATLSPLPPLSPSVTRAIERHRFPAQDQLYWRSREVDTSSVSALAASLHRRPPAPGLTLANEGADLTALLHLGRSPEIAARASTPDAVALLWEVCQVPDFRQLQLDDHFQLLSALYLQLTGPAEALDRGWIERHVAPLDDVTGDIDALLARMAFIRTWTYVTHHARWVDDAAGWQGRTRAIEDRLSDALHAALVRRFVDARRVGRGRAAAAARRQGRVAAAPASASAPAPFADLLRARLGLDDAIQQQPGGATGGAGPSDEWIEDLVDAPHRRFHLDGAGRISDGETALARLVRGVDLLHPEIALVVERDLGAGARLRLHRRLLAWTRDMVSALLAPLHARDGQSRAGQPSDGAGPSRETGADGLSAAARGLLYQLEQKLGAIPARVARDQVRALTSQDRQALRRLGVRVGRHVVFAPALATSDALRARVALCNALLAPGARLPAPAPSVVSMRVTDGVPEDLHAAIGYPAFGGRAIRADLVDGLAARLLGGAPPGDLAGRVGCAPEDLPEIRRAFARDRRDERRA